MCIRWVVLVTTVLVAGIHVSYQQTPCFVGNNPHAVGTQWPCSPPNNQICECGPGEKIIYHKNLGQCSGIGDVHYASFDGKRFDFQGICRYVLTRDCCGNSFSIAVQQEPWLRPTSGVSITEAVTLRFGNYIIELTKTPSKFVVKTIQPPAVVNTLPFYINNGDVYGDRQGGNIFIALKKLQVWLRWDFNMRLYVWAAPKYRGHLCGLCGDFNGKGDNDLLTPSGDVENNIPEWGKSWRTPRQPTRCKDNEPIHKIQNNPAVEKVHRETCEKLIEGDIFRQCQKRQDVKKVFTENCVTEMNACQQFGVDGCMGMGLDTYIQECKNEGKKIPNTWKAAYKCQDCVFGNDTYEHLMQWTDKNNIYQCKNGKTIWIKSVGCKWQKKYVERGWVMFFGCWKYTCNGSKLIARRIGCCFHRGTDRDYVVGRTWTCNDNKAKCCQCFRGNIIRECLFRRA